MALSYHKASYVAAGFAKLLAQVLVIFPVQQGRLLEENYTKDSVDKSGIQAYRQLLDKVSSLGPITFFR